MVGRNERARLAATRRTGRVIANPLKQADERNIERTLTEASRQGRGQLDASSTLGAQTREPAPVLAAPVLVFPLKSLGPSPRLDHDEAGAFGDRGPGLGRALPRPVAGQPSLRIV